ncbi:MAG: hypothetical protein A2675_02580 [Candidatus Yonathbacteria bacterium RIFCSPHIGHO2_01_FULL_51_10]|uniref:UPF0102 protein A2675_02580 n=1 Tax=Candidatus Yonathbacteria bacterium RIFCSPHIGHO2_01_FULL_51_10 TaxID=1802723 RepID=A0A1G2S3E6_9BACT|nr:MAG: hypothetical protein A2675_02580 [Candidatus Yonathbacteria bacterium RIFCSPHIGHO2_01_FULL_51_10]
MALTKKQEIGALGEDIACKYLKNKGFVIVERNFWRKWGEIDIIAQKGGIIHFFEVKTLSRENLGSVTRENDGFLPEENIHPKKIERMLRAVQSYLALVEGDEVEWQCDAVAVWVDVSKKKAMVRMIEHIA